MADVFSPQVQALDKEPQEVLATGILGGRIRVAQFNVDLTDVGSSDYANLIDLPASAYLLEVNLHQDASDGTLFDLGDDNKVDGIIDGQAIDQTLTIRAAQNNSTGTNGMGPEDFHKQLWEVLGYTSRVAPKRNIRLRLTPNSEPADFNIFGSIFYVTD